MTKDNLQGFATTLKPGRSLAAGDRLDHKGIAGTVKLIFEVETVGGQVLIRGVAELDEGSGQAQA